MPEMPETGKKQRVATSEAQQTWNVVGAMMVLENYRWLRHEAEEAGVRIVPLKGIDLLQSLYAERYDRPVRDIDVWTDSEASCRRLAEHLLEGGAYRLEFPFGLDPATLHAKGKVSLVAAAPLKVNIDLHFAFVTKKFFSRTTGSFNADAGIRASSGEMDPLDRWLFLAQHAAFHSYCDPKWPRDIGLLYEAMSPGQREELAQVAGRYGFRRVLLASLQRLSAEYPAAAAALETTPVTRQEERFLRFAARNMITRKHTLRERIVSSYWEFTFIDTSADRRRMTRRLLWPEKGTLANMYRIRHTWLTPFYRALNLAVSSLSCAAFWTGYRISSRP